MADLLTALEVEIAFFPYRGRFHPDIYRSEWLLVFLEAHIGEFDRLFFFDAFDVFFQRDPFDRLVSPGEITFVTEGIRIREHRRNTQILAACVGDAAALEAGPNPLLCSGTVAGDARAFIPYLKVLTRNLTRWHGCPNDQPQINHLAWNRVLEKAGITFRVVGCPGPVNSMIFCGKHQLKFDGELFDISDNSTTLSTAVTHHYQTWPVVERNYHARCGLPLKHREKASGNSRRRR
jgi:hypothetical protein